jgi:glucose-1-phosphate thymidylyltransferase
MRYPKELMPIAFLNRPDEVARPVTVAELALNMVRAARISHCFMVVSPSKPEILKYFGNGQDLSLHIAYVSQESARGLANAVDCAYEWVREDNVALVMPDTVISPEGALGTVTEILDSQHADVALGVFPTEIPEQLGPVRMSASGVVDEVLDKPAHTDIRNCWGLAAWGPRFTELLHRFVADTSDGQTPSVGLAFNAAVQRGLKVRAVLFDGGQYIDVGSPAGVRAALAATSLEIH